MKKIFFHHGGTRVVFRKSEIWRNFTLRIHILTGTFGWLDLFLICCLF